MSEGNEDQADLQLWRAGDQAAARRLFERYVDRLVEMARRRLSHRLARRVDAEDIVQSVFRTFFNRVRQGQFTIQEGEDVCKLLASITLHKTLRQVAFHKRAKRDATQEASPGDDNQEFMMTLLTEEPTPEDAASFVDQLDFFLRELRPEDRRIIEMRLEGHSNVEIASKLGISDRKIRRLLERLRGLAEQQQMLPS